MSISNSFAEEIIITGSRITSSDFYDMPAVTLTRSADFIIQEIRLINDSRSDKNRADELRDTINNLVKSAEKKKNIEVSHGDGFLVPVKLNDDSLQFMDDRDRDDSNYVNLYVKIQVDKNASFKDQVVELRKFVSKVKTEGRTIIEFLGSIGLSIIKPEQYRYEIIKSIADESQKLKELVGGNCEVYLEGLEGRVQWERTDYSELTLYIGYATQLQCK